MSSSSNIKVELGEFCAARTLNKVVEGNRGFIVDGVHCRGALKILGRSFYDGNFRRFRVGRRGAGGSSRLLGEAFHRHVFHKYMCGFVVCTCTKKRCTCKKLCVCKERFGKATRRSRCMHSAIDHMLDEFDRFLRENNLQVLDCETVAAIPAMRMGTAIDVVCVDSLENPKEVCIIELKTGYVIDRMKVRTINGKAGMSGEAGKSIPNCVHNHHQLQLWFGSEAFERTYKLPVTRAYVVYVNDKRRYAAYPRAPWWDKKADRNRLLEQLSLATTTTT